MTRILMLSPSTKLSETLFLALQSLRASLLAAKGIYFPDAELATAGIHCLKVPKESAALRAEGIFEF